MDRGESEADQGVRDSVPKEKVSSECILSEESCPLESQRRRVESPDSFLPKSVAFYRVEEGKKIRIVAFGATTE